LIVRCERCETRFKLDETRLPARGARVRCSRCKHAFFVQPPEASRDDVVHGLAREAASGKTQPPEPAWDLDEVTNGRTARRAGPPRAERTPPASLEADDDSDWTFEDALPSLAGDAAALDLREPAAAAPEADPNESSFAGLGDPESWNLLAPPAAPEPPRAAKPALAARPAAPARPEPQAAPRADAAPVVPAPVVAAAPAAPVEAIQPPPARLAALQPTQTGVAAWAGWAGVALLASAIGWGALRAPAEATASLGPVAGFELVQARGRWIENALAGPILVVSGELRNPGPAPRALGSAVVVSLLESDGTPIEASVATAGAPFGDQRLRERDPLELRAEAERAAGALAARELAPGESLPFDAVFERAPGGAERFDLDTKPIAHPVPEAPAPPSAVPPTQPPPAT
jgi:predicted Zn finger-like uncharacterized protein